MAYIYPEAELIKITNDSLPILIANNDMKMR